jgi:hypothetical protein
MTSLKRMMMGACAVATLAGCAATQQARDVETSGFLGNDYAMLREGEEGEALLVYRNPNADWAAYDNVKLDPVTIWVGEESAFEDFSAEDQQTLADMFYTAIHQELAKDYAMVDALGPDVLHIQVALTDGEASNPALDTISTVVPMGLAMSQTVGLVTGEPTFVGNASGEAKVSDGATGELLAAAVDKRVGGKSLSGEPTDSWGDVSQAMEYWAKQLRYRLCTERGGTDCVTPEA